MRFGCVFSNERITLDHTLVRTTPTKYNQFKSFKTNVFDEINLIDNFTIMRLRTCLSLLGTKQAT